MKVSEQNNLVEIRVLNTGPALPKGYEKQIFDGMMSIREANSDDQAHLGLGLFIVKLIAEFHQGNVEASNRLDASGDVFGVEFKIQLPILNSSH